MIFLQAAEAAQFVDKIVEYSLSLGILVAVILLLVGLLIYIKKTDAKTITELLALREADKEKMIEEMKSNQTMIAEVTSFLSRLIEDKKELPQTISRQFKELQEHLKDHDKSIQDRLAILEKELNKIMFKNG